MIFVLIIAILIAITTSIATLWLLTFFALSDFSYPFIDISNIKKALLIFPHPDDEALTCGGLIKKLSQEGKEITYLCLTKGEKGQEGAIFDPKLAEIRSKELKKVAEILGITKLIHDDFGDGELPKKRKSLEKRIKEVIEEEKPDLVVTYDKSGLYGHPDHIVVSEIVTNIIVGEGLSTLPMGRVKNPPLRKISLWYISFPPKFYRFTKLPLHMAENPKFLKRKTMPTHKLFTGSITLTKIRSLYAHKSQLFAFRKSVPRFMPLWFVLSARMFEYYHET